MKKLYCLGLALFFLTIVLTACGKFDYGVIDDQHGEPVGEAKIVLGENETTTNEQGSFIFKNIEPGEYVLKISKEGYINKELEVDIKKASSFLGELVMEKIE